MAAKKQEAKRPRGRPPKQIDLEMVDELAGVGCTQEEIANLLGFERNLFNTREDLSCTYKKGIENLRASLRRQQWLRARSGDTGMLIWLGKQLLGQKERQDVDVRAAMQTVEVIIDGQPRD